MTSIRCWCGMASVAALLCDASALASTTRLGGGGGLDLSLTRVVLSLLLCLAIAASLIVLLKRNGGRINLGALRGALTKGLPRDRRIQVIEARRVSVHADVCLIRCDDTEYLILCSAEQQQVLRKQSAPSEPGA